MPPFKDISGQRFGMLVAMWPAGYKGARRDIMYLCQCDCGERVPIRNGHLRNGIAKSCGCKSKRGMHGPRTLHGMTRTPELAAYCGAIVRCTKPKALRWKHYGGRGIEFRFKSFAEFFAELGPKPKPKHCILSTVFPTTTATTKRAMSAGLLRRSRTATEIAAKRKGPRPKSQAERSTTRNSILGRQQDRSGFSRSLSDNPDFHTRAEPIRGKQTPAVLETEFVLADVLRREVAPVAIEMSLQKRER